MRSTALAVVFVALSSTFAQSSRPWHEALPITWGVVTEGWQLALSAEKQSYFSNEPIQMILAAHNTAGKRRVARRTSPWDAANFTIVRVPDRTAVILRPPRDEVDRRKRQLVGGTRVIDVEAGGTMHPGFLDLRTLFDLPPGTYTIQATCKLPNLAWTADINIPSNQITISVVAR